MNVFSPLRLSFLFLIALTAGALNLPGQFRMSNFIEPNRGITMDLQLYYENLPPSGFIPIRLVITNETSNDHTWNLLSESGIRYRGTGTYAPDTQRASFSLSVPARSTRRFELLLPLSQTSSGTRHYGRNLSLNFSGYAIRSDRMPLQRYSSSDDTSHGFIGFSRSFGGPAFTALQESFGSSHRHSHMLPPGEVLNMAFPAFTADWRGLSGFSLLILKATDWENLGDPEQNAVRRWIMHGGDLLLVHAEGQPIRASGLPRQTVAEGRHAWGLGNVIHLVTPRAEAVSDLLAAEVRLAKGLVNWFPQGTALNQWEARRDLDRGLPGSTLMIIFVFVFGIIIGPVNLFVFAGKKNRARILWTTPLISLVGCLVLILMILLLEGTGGEGHRFVLAVHDHNRNEVHLHQEQITRTGLLLNRGFTLDEDALIERIPGVDPVYEARRTLVRTGSHFRGDWFHNRSMQAHWLRGTSSSRARLTLEENENSTVHSTFPDTLETVFIRDAEGVFWRADQLRSGESKVLTEVSLKDMQDWIEHLIENISTGSRDLVYRLSSSISDEPGEPFFLASTNSPESFVYSTLPSITWQESTLLHFGLLP